MLSIKLGKSDLTAEEVGDRIKVTFNQEFKVDLIPGQIYGGPCKGDNENDKSELGEPKRRTLDDLIKDIKESSSPQPELDVMCNLYSRGHNWIHDVRESFGLPSIRHLLNHDPSQVLTKFKIGQSVFFFGGEGRFWNGVITAIGKTEALVKGNGLAWLPFESLHSTLDEAYEAKEIKEKEVKEKADRLSRAQSFKIGQEAYFIALDCGVYTALKCSIIDMGEYEASIKLSAVVRRSVVESKDVFHTRNEANDEIFIRQQILNSRG